MLFDIELPEVCRVSEDDGVYCAMEQHRVGRKGQYLYNFGSIVIDITHITTEKLSVLLKCDYLLFPTKHFLYNETTSPPPNPK